MRRRHKPNLLISAPLLVGAGMIASTASGLPLEWATAAVGLEVVSASGLALDDKGDSHVVGTFRGEATLGVGEMTEAVLTSAGESDIFVARYDPTGLLVWATDAGGSLADGGAGIAVDGAGDTYVTGSFRGTATFGAGEANETVLTSDGERDVFVAKYDGGTGSLVWATRAGGAALDIGHSIAVDAAGESYVTGNFAGTTTFGAGEPNETVLTSDGGGDVFVAAYDGSGRLVWATRAGGIENDAGTGIALDSGGSLYLTGEFRGVATFGAGEPNQTVLTSAGSRDIFVAGYDGSGQLVWATGAGGPLLERAGRLSVDAFGHCWVSGNFVGTATFGAGEPNENVLASAGDADVFFARYDDSGLLLWAKRAGGTGYDEAFGVAVGPGAEGRVTGHFRGTATFGAGEPNETVLVSDASDMFLAEYAPSGLLVAATHAGGASGELASGAGLAVDGLGNSRVAGGFTGSITFGAGEPNETSFVSVGDFDAFIARFVSVTVFGDGFEAGSVQRWSASVP